jgi:nucleoside-diphosphate-sugar epimerase
LNFLTLNAKKMTRILITGGAGFLGSRITKKLIELGHEVHLVLRKSTDKSRIASILHNIVIHEGNLTTPNCLTQILGKVKPETVIHGAASGGHSGSKERLSLFNNNILVAFNLIEALKESTVQRLIHIGGSSCYGAHHDPISENHVLQPASAYGAQKACVSILLNQACLEYKLPFIELRPFSIYGFGESKNRLIPKAINAALTGAGLPTTTKDAVHDFIFVDDVVDACIASLSKPDINHKIFNIGTGVQTSNTAVIAMIEKLTGRPINKIQNAYPNHIEDKERWCANTSLTEKELGWKAKTTLTEGLQYCINDYLATQHEN